jgi:hypothetical protein
MDEKGDNVRVVATSVSHAGESGLSSHIPYEALPLIFEKLNLEDLVVVQCVSKAFHTAASKPEIWTNVPLVVRKFRGKKLTELSDILKMHDQMFTSILDRAKGIPRRNITVIDIKIFEPLTFRSLKALLRTVDKSAKPPNYISLP